MTKRGHSTITHGFVAISVVVLLALSGSQFEPTLLLLPFFFVIALLLAIAFGSALAAANVFVPDVGQVLPAVLGLWFWLTSIVWPLARIAPDWQFVAFLNPMTFVVTGYGAALTNAPLPVDVTYLPLFVLLTVAFCWLCLYLFTRMQYPFANAL